MTHMTRSTYLPSRDCGAHPLVDAMFIKAVTPAEADKLLRMVQQNIPAEPVPF